MKTKTYRILTAAIATILTSVSLHAADEATPRKERRGSEEMRKVRDYFRDARGRFDANKDRKLDETEIAAYKAAAENGSFPKPPVVTGSVPKRLKKFDTDNDGTLSDAERVEFASKALSREMHRPHGKRRGLPPELVKQYDTDNDGRLNNTERQALKADVQSGKVQRPSRRGTEV